jgi:hypothetical protein
MAENRPNLTNAREVSRSPHYGPGVLTQPVVLPATGPESVNQKANAASNARVAAAVRTNDPTAGTNSRTVPRPINPLNTVAGN